MPDGEIHEGHVLDALASLPAESVHMAVTSPPYWGLRKYAGEQTTRWSDGEWAYGLEDTPERWADHTIEWLRAVRRVLRRDGTVWLNVGDSYSGSWGDYSGAKRPTNPDTWERPSYTENKERPPSSYPLHGYKPLDLIHTPSLLIPRLLADGWYLRSVIVWAKPNPMPESVAGWRWERCRNKTANGSRPTGKTNPDRGDAGRADVGGNPWNEYADCPGCARFTPNDGLVLRRGSWRPTEATEWILMLAKSANYYADGEVVREPQSPDGRHDTLYKGASTYDGIRDDAVRGWERWPNPAGRNLRNVWQFPTQSFAESHFAVFPEELVKRCIMAGTSEAGVCAVCGSPWARVIRPSDRYSAHLGGPGGPGFSKDDWESNGGFGSMKSKVYPSATAEYLTIGWRPTCAHSEATPAVILDPFGGSGTSAVVARSLVRRFVLCELSSDYVQMSLKRLEQTQPALGLVS